MLDVTQFEQLGKKKIDLNNFVEMSTPKRVVDIDTVVGYIGKSGKYHYLAVTIGAGVIKQLGWKNGDKIIFLQHKKEPATFLLRKKDNGNLLSCVKASKHVYTYRVRRNLRKDTKKFDLGAKGKCKSFSVEEVGSEKALLISF